MDGIWIGKNVASDFDFSSSLLIEDLLPSNMRVRSERPFFRDGSFLFFTFELLADGSAMGGKTMTGASYGFTVSGLPLREVVSEYKAGKGEGVAPDLVVSGL